jgi:CheY-like chemotaxis protein
MEGGNSVLAGKRVLVVEDEHLVALALAEELELAGAVVIGPAASLGTALELIERNELDGAILDIELQSRLSYPAADALLARTIPFLFTTGYDASVVPDAYDGVPTVQKPVHSEAVLETLARFFRRD